MASASASTSDSRPRCSRLSNRGDDAGSRHRSNSHAQRARLPALSARGNHDRYPGVPGCGLSPPRRQLRIERITQTVAQEVERVQRDPQRKAPEHNEPPIDSDFHADCGLLALPASCRINLAVPNERPQFDLTRERQDAASAKTGKLSIQKQCLAAAPRKGRRPGHVLYASCRRFAERLWFDALFCFRDLTWHVAKP